MVCLSSTSVPFNISEVKVRAYDDLGRSNVVYVDLEGIYEAKYAFARVREILEKEGLRDGTIVGVLFTHYDEWHYLDPSAEVLVDEDYPGDPIDDDFVYDENRKRRRYA